MYEIACDQCGQIGSHPSHVGASEKAAFHIDETDHAVSVVGMTDS